MEIHEYTDISGILGVALSQETMTMLPASSKDANEHAHARLQILISVFVIFSFQSIRKKRRKNIWYDFSFEFSFNCKKLNFHEIFLYLFDEYLSLSSA